MNIQKISFWLSILFIPFQLSSQDSTFQLINTISITSDFFTTDKLQQIYVVTNSNTIIKYAPDGLEQYRFSNNTLGDLGYVDATDPFNLLLYYPDYQLVVTLDRTLNQTGKLSLIDAGVVQARTVGLSNDGNIWVYDEASFQLRKFSRTGEVLFESQNLSLVLGKAPQPIQIIDRENWVYLNDPAQGILVFDNFGQYSKTIPIKNRQTFQLLDNHLIFKQKEQIELYDLKSFLSATLVLPANVVETDQIQIQKNRLFVKKLNVIEIYSWK